MGSLSEEVRIEVLCGHICDLEAENAKLKQELEAVGTAAYLYGRDDLKAENAKLCQQLADVTESMGRVEERCAKLRELVKLTYAFLAWADGATFSDGTPAVHASDRREVEDRMRELGVEVDE